MSRSASERDQSALTRMLEDRVQRGDSLAQIARTTHLKATMLRRVAKRNGIRYRNQRPQKRVVNAAISDVVLHGLSVRQAARNRGLSKTAVHRYVQQRRQKTIDRAGAVRFETRSGVCPEHGPVTVWPCVACLAMGR